MNNPLRTTSALNFGLLVASLPLGATFLLLSYEKFAYIGIKNFVELNTKYLPQFLPKPIGQTYLYALPFVECIVGILLIVGLFTRTASTLAALMLLSFIIAATGVFPKDPYWHYVHFNVVYLGLAILLMTTGAGRISADEQFFHGQHGGFGR